jgi:hypothetical protein
MRFRYVLPRPGAAGPLAPFATVAAAFAALLASCASMTNGTEQVVSVDTPGLPGTECMLSTSERTVRVVTPATVNVKRSRQPIEVVCMREGYRKARAYFASASDPGRRGNFVVGFASPLVGTVGDMIDRSNGAAYQYVPSSLEVPMTVVEPETPAQADASTPAAAAAADANRASGAATAD